MRVLTVLSAIVIVVGLTGCAAAPEEAAGTGFTPMPHATLAQLMRGIPFPNSNTIFDTQDLDPANADGAGAGPGAGATAAYGDLYGGWQGVENAALAIAETATLIMIPGRLCENGLPAPVGNADFLMFAEGLRDAGLEAYRVAQTKDIDAIIDVGGTLSDACAFCHEVYRDKPEGEMRCIP